MADLILLPTPEGTHAAIEADAIRALIGYLEQTETTRDDTKGGADHG
jgi:hypothetical protein